MERIILIEGQYYSESIPYLAMRLGVDSYSLFNSLYAAEENLGQRLSISGTLRVDRERFAFQKISGVFRLSENLEIEIVPKFMEGDETWRTEFLLLLAKTRWGAFFENRSVTASKGKELGINNLIATIFLSMFDKASHVPIRQYRRYLFQGFEIEGDLNEETVICPEIDGFTQHITEFSKSNVFNSVISYAAQVLCKFVTDFNLLEGLRQAISTLGVQSGLPSYLPKAIPSRFSNWSGLYDMSLDVINGYGVDVLDSGELLGSGFVIRTADAWEEFIRQSLVSGLKKCTVSFQEKFQFAIRNNSRVQVRPDYTVRSFDGGSVLADAKYKYADAKAKSISNADIYEGWAFMEAAGISRLILLYPYVDDDMEGSIEQFQCVTDGHKQILGFRVNPKLAGSDGIVFFSEELSKTIQPYVTSK